MSASTQTPKRFEQQGLPALYYAADETSLRSQTTYLRLFAAVLGLTVMAPVVIVAATACPDLSQPARFLAAIGLIISLVLTGRIKESQKERTWYGARAVAESVKTITWRFAMAAEPFPTTLNNAEVDELVRSKLIEILKDRKSLNYSAAGDANSQAQITEEMRALRREQWELRMAIYLKDRIQDQRKWYASKAKSSDTLESLYFWIILAVQLISVVAASAFAVWPALHLNLTAVFTAATASLFAWLQVKRYQETSQSYALAAHDLGIIEAGAATLHSEQAFAKFVADAENAMSREHTLWAARRDAK
jgi:hypothetical protein